MDAVAIGVAEGCFVGTLQGEQVGIQGRPGRPDHARRARREQAHEGVVKDKKTGQQTDGVGKHDFVFFSDQMLHRVDSSCWAWKGWGVSLFEL